MRGEKQEKPEDAFDAAIPEQMRMVDIGGTFEMYGYNFVRVSTYQFQLTDDSQESYMFDAEDVFKRKLADVKDRIKKLERDLQHLMIGEREYYRAARELMREESMLEDFARNLEVYARTCYHVNPLRD
jgi:hypothetical protein